MALYLNENTFDSELLDTTNSGILCENFTYVIDNLIKYVNPNISYGNVKLPEIIGGPRRILRAMRGENLGYTYKSAAEKSKISSRGTKTIHAFGEDLLVEEWTVSHGDVSDPELGEKYPAQDKDGPRGPYTCLITARISLQKKTPTRCYLQCNCKDFKVTFYSKLNSEGYTNAQSLPAPTGKVPQSPAMCKHLYAIYSKYYTNLVNKVEQYKIDQNPGLFGNVGSTTAQSNTTTMPAPVSSSPIAKTKEEAIPLIIARLKQEFNRLKNTEVAYLDSRGKAAGGGRHHLYMFSVVLLNGQLRAIAYRNKETADAAFKTSGPIQLLVIPDNPKIWQLFKHKSDHALFWDWIKTHTGEMPEKLNKAIQKKTGVAVYLEQTEVPMSDWQFINNDKNSTILQAMSELS